MALSTLSSVTLASEPMPKTILPLSISSSSYMIIVKNASSCKYSTFWNNSGQKKKMLSNRQKVMIRKTMMTKMMMNLSRRMMNWNISRKKQVLLLRWLRN